MPQRGRRLSTAGGFIVPVSVLAHLPGSIHRPDTKRRGWGDLREWVYYTRKRERGREGGGGVSKPRYTRDLWSCLLPNPVIVIYIRMTLLTSSFKTDLCVHFSSSSSMPTILVYRPFILVRQDIQYIDTFTIPLSSTVRQIISTYFCILLLTFRSTYWRHQLRGP